jgi:hypothetical protein
VHDFKWTTDWRCEWLLMMASFKVERKLSEEIHYRTLSLLLMDRQGRATGHSVMTHHPREALRIKGSTPGVMHFFDNVIDRSDITQINRNGDIFAKT